MKLYLHLRYALLLLMLLTIAALTVDASAEGQINGFLKIRRALYGTSGLRST